MVRKPRKETVEYTVRRPVWETKEQEYTVMVPHQETRQGTRRVCEVVPVTKTRKVCRRTGHWETRRFDACSGCACHPRGCPSACGDCGHAVRTRRCWVPEVVYEEVLCTTYERQWKEVPYEYTATVCRPETRTREVKVCRMVSEQKTREVTRYECVPEERTREVQQTRYVRVPKTREVEYTVCVPEEREEEVEVTTCKMVPAKKTETYQVCVPYTEMEQREVRVCRMVQETREVTVCPDVCDDYAADRRCPHRRHRICRRCR